MRGFKSSLSYSVSFQLTNAIYKVLYGRCEGTFGLIITEKRITRSTKQQRLFYMGNE